MKNKLKKNNRGWIRIIEAFMSIILILGILAVSLNPGRVIGEETKKIYEMEQTISKEIQLDYDSRNEILNYGTLPVGWDSFSSNLKNQIENRKLNYMNCTGQVCSLNDMCELSNLPEKNIYVQEIPIVAKADVYDARKLKLFCWEK